MKHPLPSDAPIRTLWIFDVLFLVSGLLITFGGRSDADTVAGAINGRRPFWDERFGR